jgi:hypothetical protein
LTLRVKLRDQNTYFAFLYKTKIGNACVRVSERASHVRRLSWRRTLRGSTRDLIPTRSTTWTPPTTRPFPHQISATSRAPSARSTTARSTGGGKQPVPGAPTTTKSTAAPPPFAAQPTEVMKLLHPHPPRPLHPTKRRPQSWSGGGGGS